MENLSNILFHKLPLCLFWRALPFYGAPPQRHFCRHHRVGRRSGACQQYPEHRPPLHPPLVSVRPPPPVPLLRGRSAPGLGLRRRWRARRAKSARHALAAIVVYFGGVPSRRAGAVRRRGDRSSSSTRARRLRRPADVPRRGCRAASARVAQTGEG